MGSENEILEAIAKNRLLCTGRVGELRCIYAANETIRRRKVKAVWIAAMRRHYLLVDRYLMLRDWAPPLYDGEEQPPHGDVQANELWAPPRPAEVPGSIRPNLVVEIEARLSETA